MFEHRWGSGGMSVGRDGVTAKISTFAGQLMHFAQSVDIVDKPTFDAVRALVVRYIQELGAEYFELLQKETTGNGSPKTMLRTFWSSDERFHAWVVESENGKFKNPIIHAFATHK